MPEALLLLAVLTGLQSAGPATAVADPVAPILTRMSERARALRSLTGELRQLRSYPLLEVADPPETGSLWLERTDRGPRLRLELREPTHRILTWADGRYVLYQPALRQAIVGQLAVVDGATGEGASPERGFLELFLSAPAELTRRYAVRSNEDAAVGAHLRFEPLPGVATTYAQIDAWLDPEHGLPLIQELREHDGTFTRIELTGVAVDSTIDERRFRIELPPGVERIRG